MALEGGKYGGKIAVLAGLGIAAATAGWNVLGDKSKNDEVAEVSEMQQDDKLAEEVGGEDVSGVATVQADILQQLGLPTNLPKLHGVEEVRDPQILLAENKKFLKQADEWLHVQSKPFDFSSYGEEIREIVLEEKRHFDDLVAKTEDVMMYNRSFQQRKTALEAAFPNYALVAEPRGDGTFFVHLTERPGLFDLDYRTASGYEPSSDLTDWEIVDLGGMIMMKHKRGDTYLPDNDGDLVQHLDTTFKQFALRRKWQDERIDSGSEVPLSEYLEAME